MKLTLSSISTLLGLPLLKKGDIQYIQTNETFVITENPFTKNLELNSLENYESQPLSLQHLTDLLEFKAIQNIRCKTCCDKTITS